MSGWTDERRVRQAAAIRQWAPWEKSTGPTSLDGKTKVSKNAQKHGESAQGADRSLSRGAVAHSLGLPLESCPAPLIEAKRLALKIKRELKGRG
jgi:hypothetical protein